eukprot:TRINITY_DN409_c0_g1_i4.p1 TRINITY_DN409_c0_g1~~TRINITY_DN409_c0_g1_i4.p1  ORF type:complete len:346 (-),score=65.15 TRINITY_DN409_c0_g1_i4:86-988(-)
MVQNMHGGDLKDFKYGKHMGLKEVRKGMYTDDTNSTLALASSLVENKGLVPSHAALQYAKFWKMTPIRGYPPSAMRVMQAVFDGEDYKTTGTICFPEGSFANGGAMRIGPVGLAFRNAKDEDLHEAVRLAIISSHVHPEAIDGAWIVAKVISMFIASKPSDIEPLKFLKDVYSFSRNPKMQKQIQKLIDKFNTEISDIDVVNMLGEEFQIKSTEAVPCALWAVAKNIENPEQCIIKAVNMAGDADTVGAITGSMIGALHGNSWIPDRWLNELEQGERGRDYAIDLGKKLAELDLHKVNSE